MGVQRFRFAGKWLLAVMVSMSIPTSIHAGECYYLVMFASKQIPWNNPNYSHTFATFVKATTEGLSLDRCRIETVTISWFPATMRIRTLSLRPETGMLLDLPTTFRWAQDNGTRVSMWGPYQIQPELYERSRVRACQLHSGTIRYKLIDRLHRPGTVDCIHAVSDMDVDAGLLQSRAAYGDAASFIVLHHFCRWIIHPEVTHDWLIGRLCLDGYCLLRRDFCSRPEGLLPILPPYYERSPCPGTAAMEVEVSASLANRMAPTTPRSSEQFP